LQAKLDAPGPLYALDGTGWQTRGVVRSLTIAASSYFMAAHMMQEALPVKSL
jgi:hypothetical protein